METEDKFLKRAKVLLDEAEKNLDASTVARLRAARRTVIEEGSRSLAKLKPGWLLPVGGMAAAGIVLIVAGLLWFSAPNGQLLQAGVGDIELLAGKETPDFFVELEFYEWLEHQANAG
ncbi:MAG: hypothetical protein OEM48_02450 [Gammaproteobacteria bacterium]|nr:hypothetical protein [Gammaproteobacteria bacterium]